MPNRSSKPPRTSDPNSLATWIVNQATEEPPPPRPEAAQPAPLNPKEAARQAAAMLGRLGGLKGGKARAKALTKKRRAAERTRIVRARDGVARARGVEQARLRHVGLTCA